VTGEGDPTPKATTGRLARGARARALAKPPELTDLPGDDAVDDLFVDPDATVATAGRGVVIEKPIGGPLPASDRRRGDRPSRTVRSERTARADRPTRTNGAPLRGRGSRQARLERAAAGAVDGPGAPADTTGPVAGAPTDDAVADGSVESTRRWPARVVAALVAAVALVPRALTAGTFQTVDEARWMSRSVNFGNALAHFELGKMTASRDAQATMPGVTTMWLGNIARGLFWIGRKLGIVHDAAFDRSFTGIFLAQLVMGITTAVLIGIVVKMVWDWIGPTAAVVAGLFLATEPLLVAHGSVLHTDELTGLFGLLAVIAFARTFGFGGPPPTTRWRYPVLTGLFAGLAALTKVSAGLFGPSLAVFVVVALVASIRAARNDGRSWWSGTRPVLASVSVVLLTTVATILLLWPAIWANWSNQIHMLQKSAELAETGHNNFFLGTVSTDPAAYYYLVTTPLRMTPWFLAAAVLLVPVALVDRTRRTSALLLAVTAVVVVTALSLSVKKQDRYIVTALPLVAVLVGIGATDVVDRLRSWRPVLPKVAAGLGAVAGAAMLLHAVLIAPWGMTYFNPVLGGSARAEDTMLIGWGEGLEEAGKIIERYQHGDCDIDVYTPILLRPSFPCGRIEATDPRADIRVFYVNERQRATVAGANRLRARAKLIGTVRIRGILMVEIFDQRLPADG
jgi:hypothetical protein